jgi:hypothetical protein
VTGHSDHQQATRAALTAAGELDLEVLAWAVPEPVAARVNAEHGTSFRGRCAAETDLTVVVRPRAPAARHRLPPQPGHRQTRATTAPRAGRPHRTAALAPPPGPSRVTMVDPRPERTYH